MTTSQFSYLDEQWERKQKNMKREELGKERIVKAWSWVDGVYAVVETLRWWRCHGCRTSSEKSCRHEIESKRLCPLQVTLERQDCPVPLDLTLLSPKPKCWTERWMQDMWLALLAFRLASIWSSLHMPSFLPFGMKYLHHTIVYYEHTLWYLILQWLIVKSFLLSFRRDFRVRILA